MHQKPRHQEKPSTIEPEWHIWNVQQNKGVVVEALKQL